MAEDDLKALFSELQDDIKQISCPRGATQRTYEQWLTTLQTTKTSEIVASDLQNSLLALTQHVLDANISQRDYADALFLVLAESTRKHPLWRSLFGVPNTAADDVQCRSILDVATQIIGQPVNGNHDLLKNCLRLIANCCADNDINRRFVLDNGVMESLVDLCKRGVEVNIVVPTIYNICNDYKDPTAASNLAEQITGSELDKSVDTVQAPSLAAKQLAAASPSRPVTFQILLSLTASCSADRRPFLAELVELATQDHAVESKHTLLAEHGYSWTFTTHEQQWHTLIAAEALADSSSECRMHVLRALLNLLATPRWTKSLLRDGDDSVWRLIHLFRIQKLSENDDTDIDADADDGDGDDFSQELADCQKQFLKNFYHLSGMSEFALAQTDEVSAHKAIAALLAAYPQSEEQSDSIRITQDHFFIACCLIVLAQLAAEETVREQLLDNQALITALAALLAVEEDNDILYPAVMLIARMSLTTRQELPLARQTLLQPMSRLLSGKGRGLILPFEVVNAYRMLIRNRPHYFDLFTAKSGPCEDDIISTVVVMFDKTIEAGTKLEIGQFCIEILRTMFSNTKDLDDTTDPSGLPANAPAFASFLNSFAAKLAEILMFVCTQAEPKHERVHGWFGFGMLSVWGAGRIAILLALENDEFRKVLTQIAAEDNGPDVQNLKLVLGKLQACPRSEMSVDTVELLSTAGQRLGLQLNFNP